QPRRIPDVLEPFVEHTRLRATLLRPPEARGSHGATIGGHEEDISTRGSGDGGGRGGVRREDARAGTGRSESGEASGPRAARRRGALDVRKGAASGPRPDVV